MTDRNRPRAFTLIELLACQPSLLRRSSLGYEGREPWRRQAKAAFTLIELLVVIAILAILAGLLLPMFGHAKEKANKARCLGNLRQIAAAINIQLDELYPAMPNRATDCVDWGQGAVDLLPFLGNNTAIFDCPSNKGIWRDDFTDLPGYDNTYTDYEFNGFLVRCDSRAETVDRKQTGITKYSLAAYAYDVPYHPDEAKRAHEGGVNCAYLDGHAGWVADKDMGADTTTNWFWLRGHTFGPS